MSTTITYTLYKKYVLCFGQDVANAETISLDKNEIAKSGKVGLKKIFSSFSSTDSTPRMMEKNIREEEIEQEEVKFEQNIFKDDDSIDLSFGLATIEAFAGDRHEHVLVSDNVQDINVIPRLVSRGNKYFTHLFILNGRTLLLFLLIVARIFAC